MTSIDQVIAIDGPAGCGKSTIAKMLSDKFSFNYIDSGSLFRALAYFLFQRGTQENFENDSWLEKQLGEVKLNYDYLDQQVILVLNSENISDKIREHDVSMKASKVSRYPQVRNVVDAIQEEIVTNSKRISVIEGRDIGTVVFPNALLKVFLTATAQARALRRFNQLKEKGMLENLSIEQIRADIEERDYKDSNREIAPLKKAQDAIGVDTSEMSIETVLKEVSELVKDRGLI